MMDGKNDKCHFPCTHSATALPAHSAQVSELTCRRCRITTTIIAIKLVSIWILSPFHTQRSKITFFFVSFTFNDLRTQTSSYYSIISAKSMVRGY